jgi:cyclopropane-fatty-acyl-phospholipid synthase
MGRGQAEIPRADDRELHRTYFERCASLLSADGVMVLQAITIDDRLYDVEKAQRSFMNSLIFPNGCLPSVEVIARNVARSSDLRMVDLEDITPHYAETLRRWRANVDAQASASSRSATTSASCGRGGCIWASARPA